MKVLFVTDLPVMISHPVSVGIILGLVLGKTLGITLFSWFFCKLGFTSLPEGVTFTHIAGVGFTMSLFIAGLAFSEPEYIWTSKIGILAGSLMSGITGYVILRLFLKRSRTMEKV